MMDQSPRARAGEQAPARQSNWRSWVRWPLWLLAPGQLGLIVLMVKMALVPTEETYLREPGGDLAAMAMLPHLMVVLIVGGLLLALGWSSLKRWERMLLLPLYLLCFSPWLWLTVLGVADLFE